MLPAEKQARSDLLPAGINVPALLLFLFFFSYITLQLAASFSLPMLMQRWCLQIATSVSGRCKSARVTLSKAAGVCFFIIVKRHRIRGPRLCYPSAATLFWLSAGVWMSSSELDEEKIKIDKGQSGSNFLSMPSATSASDLNYKGCSSVKVVQIFAVQS